MKCRNEKYEKVKYQLVQSYKRWLAYSEWANSALPLSNFHLQNFGTKNVEPKLRDQIIWLKFHCRCLTYTSLQNLKEWGQN